MTSRELVLKRHVPQARLANEDDTISLVLKAAGREFPEVHEYWDGNWMMIHLVFSMPGMHIDFVDPCIRTDELEDFLEELKSFSQEHVLGIETDFTEPILYLNMQVVEPGGDVIATQVEINVLAEQAQAGMTVEMDVTMDAVEEFIRGIEEILREYPVVDRETH